MKDCLVRKLFNIQSTLWPLQHTGFVDIHAFLFGITFAVTDYRPV